MDDKPIDTLNMIPLIDIMLVLLTIVLTTSSFIATGRIPVKLPEASAAELDPRDQAKNLEIDSQGRLFYEDLQIEISDLGKELGRLDKATPILLRADKTIQLQSFVDVVDELKKLKFTKVAVQTIKSTK